MLMVLSLDLVWVTYVVIDVKLVISKLKRGELSLHKISTIINDENEAAMIRRMYLEEVLGVKLNAIAHNVLNFNELVGKNIENPIGAIQVPLGIAGPLKILGEYARGYYYIPLATTEGALVASINRGCKAVTLSGGVKARIIFDGMTRAPCIWTPSIDEALRFISWVRKNLAKLREVAKTTTKHGELRDLETYVVGNMVWLRFIYSTGDAMGMNMVTISVDKVMEWIVRNYPGEVKYLSLSGNMCVDKKPSVINALLGRGKSLSLIHI